MREHVFIGKIKGILTDNSFDRVQGRQQRGKLDTKGLYRSPVSSRVFKRKLGRLNKKYDCTVLVDTSGSMGNNVIPGITREHMALLASMHLHKALTTAKIPTRVRSFNYVLKTLIPLSKNPLTDSEYTTIVDEAKYTQLNAYITASTTSKGEGKLMPIIHADLPLHKKLTEIYNDSMSKSMRDGSLMKELTEKLQSHGIQDRHVSYISESRGENIDPVAIQWAITKAIEESGEDSKHIIIVLSDGQPAIPYNMVFPFKDGVSQNIEQMRYPKEGDLQQTVKDALKKGILFVGIGIGYEGIKKHYPPQFCHVLGARPTGKDNSRETSSNSKKLHKPESVLFQAVAEQILKHVKRG